MPSSEANGYKCAQDNDGSGAKGANEWLAVKFEEMHDMYQGVQGKSHFAIRQYIQGVFLPYSFDFANG